MQDSIETIIEQCKLGNQRAQMQLYDTYCKAMFSITCRYIDNIEDAKDVMQEGFLKAFLNLDSFTPNYTIGTWLKRIIINTAIDFLKKRSLVYTSFDENLELIAEEDWYLDDQTTKTAILQAINQLAEKYKVVLTLYLIEAYDHEEIAIILGIPVKTSRTHLRRGKLLVQKFLKNNHEAAVKK